MPSFTIRQGDVGRTFAVVLRDAAGVFITLAVGATATFRMKERATGHEVTGAAAVTDYAPGTRNKLSFAFPAGASDIPGLYDAIFVVSSPGGGVETYPTCSEDDALTVEVCCGL